MVEVYKERIFEKDGKYTAEILEFLVVPFVGMIVYLAYIVELEFYQIIIIILITVLAMSNLIYNYVKGHYLRLFLDEKNVLHIHITKGKEVLHEVSNPILNEIMWNYRFSRSLSQVKIFSITHRTNHNLVLSVNSLDNSSRVHFIQKLKPWQEVSPTLEYLNDLEPNAAQFIVKDVNRIKDNIFKYSSANKL